MTKELEALNDLKYRGFYYTKEGIDISTFVQMRLDIIETALKRLEKQDEILRIIKEQPMFPVYITMYKNAYEMVADRKSFALNKSVEELQAKFDLLKEELL